ncbi:hypothetical protein U1Q18_023273 [Sarracenia purpurea var. burkii]
MLPATIQTAYTVPALPAPIGFLRFGSRLAATITRFGSRSRNPLPISWIANLEILSPLVRNKETNSRGTSLPLIRGEEGLAAANQGFDSIAVAAKMKILEFSVFSFQRL